jgi:hypothetical protein
LKSQNPATITVEVNITLESVINVAIRKLLVLERLPEAMNVCVEIFGVVDAVPV